MTEILNLYNKNVSNHHLDVGVGSGLLIDHCNFPIGQVHLSLLDLNEQCLSHTSQRLKRYAPQTYKRDILNSSIKDCGKFDSISLNFVLHCLPGSLKQKTVVFENLYKMLNPGGVIFGFSILNETNEHSCLPRLILRAYNKYGVFHNSQDTFDSFNEQLNKRFSIFSSSVIGHAIRFEIRKPN